jgi:voltage-dependent potassium channel beta subunit
MEYRRLGNAGMRVSAVSLGAWITFGGSVGDDTAEEIIRTAIDGGINFIDTADAYARGEAERVVGQAIKGYDRSKLVISSKLYWPQSDDPNDRGLSRKHIMASIDRSLKRLGTDYLDIYFCHRYDQETPLEETIRAMDDLVHQGKVLYWGTSVWNAAQIEDAVGVAQQYNLYRPQVEQPRYNMLDRHIEAEIMPVAHKHGMGLTVWSPLAQGILTGKYNDGVPQDSRAAENAGLQGELNEKTLDKVRQLSAIAADHKLTMAQLALAWILRRPEISSVITGATKIRQVESNLKAAEATLDESTLARIEEILDNAPTD